MNTPRPLAQEVPVALSYNGSTQAVMMATPADLEDFAVGFSLSEQIVQTPGQIERLEVAEHETGIEVQMWLAGDAEARLMRRRRYMAGPVGCGLCGIDSLSEALRPLPPLHKGRMRLNAAEIAPAMAALSAAQPLHDATHAVHAAGYWTGGALRLAREDVGRHNALDKLIGALARIPESAAHGAILITSRVSVEMVQKAVLARAPVLIAVSAPTALAVKLADQAGLTLIACARGESHELFTHPHRIDTGSASNVA